MDLWKSRVGCEKGNNGAAHEILVRPYQKVVITVEVAVAVVARCLFFKPQKLVLGCQLETFAFFDVIKSRRSTNEARPRVIAIFKVPMTDRRTRVTFSKININTRREYFGCHS